MPIQTRRQAGYSLAEIVIIAAVLGAIVSMAVPGTQRYITDQNGTQMARNVASAFQLARTEALRTGRNHVVFLGVGGAGDVVGTPLVDANGDPAALVILDDGFSGAPGQNCRIEAGENTRVISADQRLSWGQTFADTNKAPGDLNARPLSSGSSFATPIGTSATWVLFRGDGTPVAMDAGCNVGTVGSANGGVYFTNGERDFAVVLGALGNVRVHSWDREADAWTN